jgi:GNAT superfamily N-acetyltransferase
MPLELPDTPQPLFAPSGEALRLASGARVYWKALPEGAFKTHFRDLYKETQRASGAVVLPSRRYKSRAAAPILAAGFFAEESEGELPNAPTAERQPSVPLGYCLMREDEASCLRLLNTGIHAHARGLGLYRAWIDAVSQWARALGFAELRSRHRADHNALLIPKLRAGFRICGMQVDPRFGVLAELHLPFSADGQDLLAWRMGSRPEDERIRRRRFS